MIRLKCPRCAHRLKTPAEHAGLIVRCPHCQSLVDVPKSPSTSAATPKRRDETSHPAEDPGDAPLSRPTEKIDPEELIDMTAMVDIVFFLLIFFLVTSMSGLHSSTPMPKPEQHQEGGGGGGARQREDVEADRTTVVVRIHRDDSLEVDGVPYKDLTDVAFRLQDARRTGGADLSVLVLGHANASHGVAVVIFDSAYEAGIDHVRLAVTDENE